MDNDDNRQNTARNGLGLFICHSLVQSLGGKIDIESEVGQYAEFTVTLPFGIVEESSDDTIYKSRKSHIRHKKRRKINR